MKFRVINAINNFVESLSHTEDFLNLREYLVGEIHDWFIGRGELDLYVKIFAKFLNESRKQKIVHEVMNKYTLVAGKETEKSKENPSRLLTLADVFAMIAIWTEIRRRWMKIPANTEILPWRDVVEFNLYQFKKKFFDNKNMDYTKDLTLLIISYKKMQTAWEVWKSLKKLNKEDVETIKELISKGVLKYEGKVEDNEDMLHTPH